MYNKRQVVSDVIQLDIFLGLDLYIKITSSCKDYWNHKQYFLQDLSPREGYHQKHTQKGLIANVCFEKSNGHFLSSVDKNLYSWSKCSLFCKECNCPSRWHHCFCLV